MSAQSARLQAKALATIEKFGTAGTLRKVTTGAYDPATGSPSSTTQDVAVTGVLGPSKLGPSTRLALDSGVLRAHKNVLLPGAMPVVPSTGDVYVTGDGTTWSVLQVDSVELDAQYITHSVELVR